MQYAVIIAREADSLPLAMQAEVLDFIEFLKARQGRAEDTSTPKATEEIEAFFRSFKVDTRGLYVFKHDSELGNAPARSLFARIQPQLKEGIAVPRDFSDC